MTFDRRGFTQRVANLLGVESAYQLADDLRIEVEPSLNWVIIRCTVVKKVDLDEAAPFIESLAALKDPIMRRQK